MRLSLLSGVVHRGFRCARGVCLFGVIAISSRGWKRVDVEERPRKADIGAMGEERSTSEGAVLRHTTTAADPRPLDRSLARVSPGPLEHSDSYNSSLVL